MNLHISSKLVLYFILIALGASGFFFSVYMPSPVGFYATISVAALVGFCVCLNIFHTKKSGKQLVCPTGSDCNAVVNSRYSVFFGISLEYWGMLYFALILLAYLGLIFFRDLFSTQLVGLVVLFSVAAGIFSLYLLFVQAFLLRKWCIWCILTAFLSLSIFTMSFISTDIVVNFFRQYQAVLNILTFVGFAFGVGGTTFVALLFLKFLKDTKIDEKEFSIIKDISEFIWFGFGLVLISQFALFVAHSESLLDSNTFVVSITALLLTAFSGAILMIIYAPFLIYIPWSEESDSPLIKLRRPAAILGAVSLISWYFAFITNIIDPDLTSSQLLSIFGILLIVGIIASVIWERRLGRYL